MKKSIYIILIATAIVIAAILAYLKYPHCNINCPEICLTCLDENNSTYLSCVRINEEKCECEEFPPCPIPLRG